MAAKGKNPVLHAEKEVGAIQDVLRDWVARNPNDPALEKFKNFKADGVWGEQTNELFTRWVIATQQAHNAAHPDTKIKVDGWAGDQTLSALGGDPKAAQALKNLQDVGLNRLQYRTDIHPPKGQEIGAEGAKPAAAEPKTNQAPEKQPSPSEQTAQKPEDGLGERVAIGVASVLGLGGLAQGLKVSYDRAVAPRPMATRVETPAPRTVAPVSSSIKADYAAPHRTGAADRLTGATRTPAAAAPVEKPVVPAAKPATPIEPAAPARPMATRVPVTPEPITAAPAAGKLGAEALETGAARSGLARIFSPKSAGLTAFVGLAAISGGVEAASPSGNLESSVKAGVDEIPLARIATAPHGMARMDAAITDTSMLAGAALGTPFGGPIGATIGGALGLAFGVATNAMRYRSEEDYTNAQKELLPELADSADFAAAHVPGGEEMDPLELFRNPEVAGNVYNTLNVRLLHQKQETPEQQEEFRKLKGTLGALTEFWGLEQGRLDIQTQTTKPPSSDPVAAAADPERQAIPLVLM